MFAGRVHVVLWTSNREEQWQESVCEKQRVKEKEKGDWKIEALRMVEGDRKHGREIRRLRKKD